MRGPSRQSWVSPFPLQGCWLPGFTRFMADFTVDPPRDSPQGLAEPGVGSPTGRCLCPTPCPERGINNCEHPAHRADGSDEVIWDLNKCERRWLPADSFYLAT